MLYSTIIVQVIKTTILILILTLLLLALGLISIDKSYASNGSFYQGDNRYKGFYWFESKSKNNRENNNSKADQELYYPTGDEASAAIEMRKKALDDARSQMVELAFVVDTPPQILREAIVKYKKLEVAMYDGAIRLTYANEMANFTNPEIANLPQQPTNVFANKIKRQLDEQQKLVTVREFAKDFDLVVFTDNNCPYSKAFEPVITNFAQTHGFTLDKAALGSTEGKIAQNLGITSTPTLIAVSKDAQEMFEISRGMAGISELEASIVLSSKYHKEQKTQSHSRYRHTKGKR